MHWWPRKDNSFQQSNYISCSKRSSERQILFHLPRTVIPSVVLDNCGIVSFCFEDITSTVLVVINIRYENSTKSILALCWIDVNTVIQFKFYHLEKNRSCSPLFIRPHTSFVSSMFCSQWTYCDLFWLILCFLNKQFPTHSVIYS